MAELLPVLHQHFAPRASYSRVSSSYSLLPFRFIRLDGSRYVLTNFVGEYSILSRNVLEMLVQHRLSSDSDEYRELKTKHFVVDAESSVALDLLAVKYRTKQALLPQLTGLFIFVVTLRCEHSCAYCQVSRRSVDRQAFDMSPQCSARAIDFVFRSPSPMIKIEFQGGEPLLNFELIKDIVLRAEERNEAEGRQLQFVIATNLALLTDEILEFSKAHRILFSTSLDGPAELHNKNRPRPGGNSFELATDGIRRIREALGSDAVAALMTTTHESLEHGPEIVDEYMHQGFEAIFLRPVSPYGFALKTGHADRYGTERWLQFYKDTLSYIIDLNITGRTFKEIYTALLLRKILTPFPTAYVDLQSPAGLGIACLVINYDGNIYPSDEARMLAETGDTSFRLGNVTQASYEDVITSDALIETLDQTMTEGMPMCSDCGFQPYCGSDPVFHHAIQGDRVGFKPGSSFCHRNMEVLRHVFRLLIDEPRAATVLTSWL